MNPAAKSLILKGQDNLETARRLVDDENQHDIVGYNLAQSVEFFLKALLTQRNLEFPQGDDAHDLDALMQILEEDNLSAISSHADVVELTPYNSLQNRVHQTERLKLTEYIAYVDDLKKLVGQHTM